MHSEKKLTTIPGVQIRKDDGGELHLFEGTNSGEQGRSLPGFGSMHAQETFGNVALQYYVGNGFQIWYSQYTIRASVAFISTGAMEMLELHIPLVGESMGWWDGVRQNNIRSEQFELEYAPYLQTKIEFYPGQLVTTLDVHYAPSFLTGFLDAYPRLDVFLGNVQRRQRSSLFDTVRFMHPAMQGIARDIIRYTGSAQQAISFYEQQVTLLLHAVLQRTGSFTRYPTKQDIDAVMAIRHLVQRQPQRVYTCEELSRYTGISVSKLHYTFKEIAGTSLFQFTQGVRLDYARQLLLDTNVLIQEIAWICGYNEHANFTAAFTRRFGVRPQDVRRGKIK